MKVQSTSLGTRYFTGIARVAPSSGLLKTTSESALLLRLARQLFDKQAISWRAADRFQCGVFLQC
jgi:hypothetical protein